MGAHEGIHLGEEAGADRGGVHEAEHGAADEPVQWAMQGTDVVGAENVEHGLRIAGDQTAGLTLEQHAAVELGVHAHHRGAP